MFNDARYQQFNLRQGQRLFRFDYFAHGQLIGTLTGVVESEELICGYSAPFGGIDFVRQDEFAGAIVELVQAACASARADGIRKVRIRARPSYYGTNETAAVFAFLGLGASIEACELSLGIEVWRFRTPDDYTTVLRPSIARQLRKAMATGMVFSRVESAADWAASFALLDETRRRRGAQLKISLEYILGLRRIFGKRIAMYRLALDDQLAAAALVYRVGGDLNYVVAWGDDLRYRNDRVMNLMAYNLVSTAVAEGVKIVDLGISSVNGVPDDGLIQFKRNIGATTGLRVDFSLDVA